MPSISAGQLPRGFFFSATSCGLKQSGLDLGLIISDTVSTAACVFTTNCVKAAPVLVSQKHLNESASQIRAVIVNSGNANCATGAAGITASRKTTDTLARIIGCRPEQIIICSTGVIGVPLQVEQILRALSRLNRGRSSTAREFQQFTRAIMTTDTRPKWSAANCLIGGGKVRLLGCAKGAGMIHPNMATMLAFVVTDATASASVLQRALREATAQTFNAITIDGDTSTNDTLTLLANRAAGTKGISPETADYRKFLTALKSVCHSLALQIVADGEGAHRTIEILVKGAATKQAAEKIARTIANSPLVKTAIAGGDPNWGRILAAAGRAGVKFDPRRAEIQMARIPMYRGGCAQTFSEKATHRKLLARHIPILIDLHAGKEAATVWTCDFTADYVRINASYRS